MRTPGGLNHIALTVRDLDASEQFYDRLLPFLGYTRVPVPESTQSAMNTRLLAWGGPGGSITIRPARAEVASVAPDRYAPGLNHFAFNAESRAAVDRLYQLLLEIGARILDPPADYDYMPEYYAVYFLDPSGIKLEYAFSSF